MYCQNCGEKLPKDAKFCQNCGTQVNNSNDKVKSNVIDTNGILDSSVDVVKSGSDEFRKKWSSWSSKRKFLSVIVCCCIGWIIVSSLMGALTPDKNAEMFDQTNEGKNISLIKESTGGHAYYSSNKAVYDYKLEGVLKNIPKDSEGFTVRGTFYDDNGKVIKENDKDLDHFSHYTEKSDPTAIAEMYVYELVNVSKIKVTIMNPSGDVVFDETFDFDMSKFDLSGLDDNDDNSNKNSSSSGDNSNSSSSSTGRARIEQLMDDDNRGSSGSSSGVTFVGSVNSDKFHYPSCSAAKKINDENKITFSSREDAINSGYSSCGICHP